MTVRLTVDRARWLDDVHEVARATPGLVPVVKGNGYGFGRDVLHPIAAGLADHVAVGTVHELDGVAVGVTPVVLTPAGHLPGELPHGTVLTVGSVDDVDALAGWSGLVMVKLRSSMRRYGVEPEGLADLLDAVERARCAVAGLAVHLPLAGTDADRLAEVDHWLAAVGAVSRLAGVPLWVSHLAPASLDDLRSRTAGRPVRCRVGTALWHGDKQALRLTADVLAVRRVRRGDTAGYRATPVIEDGHLVIVGAGSSHGVAPLADGRSPFHAHRQRMALLEAPHMHSSMCVVPEGASLPAVGDWIDVQRPLITTRIDELCWT